MVRHKSLGCLVARPLLAALLAALCCGFLVTPARAVEYVIQISIDALNAGAVPAWGQADVPNFWRLRTEGAWTDNARTDYTSTVTSPNHACILTGRPVADWTGKPGHLWNENGQPDPVTYWGLTLHDAHVVGTSYNGHRWAASPAKPTYEYVHSTLDVAHDAGLKTGLYSGKNRLAMEVVSYDAAHSDNGVNKVDASLVMPVDISHIPDYSQSLVNAWKAQMDSPAPLRYSFIHFADTDSAGHAWTWSTTPSTDPQSYMYTVKQVDALLGQIFAEIEGDARFAGKTAIVLTADHGGTVGTTEHNNGSKQDNYQVPFYVWGPGVTAGADLYALNPQYADPGAGRPDYNAVGQPIRNGDSANLCMRLLGLGPIPGSSIGFDQPMVVPEPSSLVLLGGGAIGLLAYAWQRRKRRA
jgi:hypothetical protein